jgi:carboxylesterase type B
VSSYVSFTGLCLSSSHRSDFVSQLNYLAYVGRGPQLNAYYTQDGVVVLDTIHHHLKYESVSEHQGAKLPILCTQSSQQNQEYNAVATAENEIAVKAAGNTYVGFRNQKSFRFLGIRYADKPARFTYASQYSGRGQTLQATAYGSQCAQGGAGSEDCLFLNIQTPYIPKQGSKAHLRPVLLWIHGGGFTGGSGADGSSDGGNLASREDIVVVTINYRLSTLGFFAVPGTDIKGNYGIADQIVALKVRSFPYHVLVP